MILYCYGNWWSENMQPHIVICYWIYFFIIGLRHSVCQTPLKYKKTQLLKRRFCPCGDKDRGARRKFWKEPLRGTKILFCGRGFKFWFTLRGRYQFWNNTFYHLSYFFRLNTLKGTAKAPAVDLSRLNTLRVMIQMRVSRLKKINVCKKQNKCLYFLDLYELLISSSGCHWRICKNVWGACGG